MLNRRRPSFFSLSPWSKMGKQYNIKQYSVTLNTGGLYMKLTTNCTVTLRK